jgi:hypothetical protein
VPEDNILSDDLLRQLISVGEVDILVGLHTHNHAKSIEHIVQVIREGLLKYFPRERVAVLNADGGSTDGTRELVRAASITDARQANSFQTLRTVHCISSQYGPSVSNGTAMHMIVAAADLLRARACAVIAPESSEIRPEWMDQLIRPVYRDHADFVAPVYRRNRFEGILVTNLLYPVTRALYGKSIREPRPGEFAFSDTLASRVVSHPMWNQDAGRLGPEVCLTLEALADGSRIVQSFLGPKGQVDRQTADLVTALRQTVGPLFWSMENADGAWGAPPEAPTLLTIGPAFDVGMDGTANVDLTRLHQMFCSGTKDLESVLKSIVSADTLSQLQYASSLGDAHFRFPDELWAKSVYEFASAYRRSVISRDHIIQALAPLYRGRAYTFISENLNTAPNVLGERIEALCLTFERFKPYLLELWSEPERGS